MIKMNKKKLAMFDMDGTLFDTKDVNYHAYKQSLEEIGYTIEYDYYCKECNGSYYKTFLPQITDGKDDTLEKIHERKKELYSNFLDKARINKGLFDLIDSIKNDYYIALITTASKKNTMEILKQFHKENDFDLILTHNDIEHTKPDPEGFIKAMNYFKIDPDNSIIFEDSKPGIEAGKRSGATVFVSIGYNE